MTVAVTMLVLGLLIGAVLGALGGGGSVLAVPVLVYVAHQDPQAATAASLVVVGVGALGGLVPHLREHNVRLGPGLAFGALGIGGSWAGTRLNQVVPEQVLLGSFAALLVLVATLMVVRRHSEPSPTHEGVRPVRVVLAGTGVGFLTGFLGVGGGFVVVPALVLSLGYRMPVAVGTSLVVIVVNATVGLVARGGQVGVPLATVLALTAGTVGGSLVGGRLVRGVAPDRLRVAFAGLLVVLGGGIALSTLTAT